VLLKIDSVAAIIEYKTELLLVRSAQDLLGRSIKNRGALRREKWLATIRQWHTTNCLAFRQESKDRFIARQCKGTRGGRTYIAPPHNPCRTALHIRLSVNIQSVRDTNIWRH